MTKGGVAILGCVFALAVMAMAADKATDLSGTWVLTKTERSISPMGGGGEGGPGDMGGGGRMGGGGMGGGGRRGGQRGQGPAADNSYEVQDLQLTIAQSASDIKIDRKWSRDGDQKSLQQTYLLDGSENRNPDDLGRGEISSRAKWHKGNFVIEGNQQVAAGNREVAMPVKQEFSLSKDGQSLTLKTTRNTPMGLLTIKQVFKKS